MVQQLSNFDQRFNGITRLYGISGAEQLKQARVIVIGIGGVGSWVAEALARTGVGTITLIDLDDICISNSNRQIHAVGSQIGNFKVESMAKRIKDINPDCHVFAKTEFLTTENINDLVPVDTSYVVDAIDSLRPKAALIRYCVSHKIKIITTGGAGGQTDPTRIVVDDLSRTVQDPLTRNLRRLLRKEYGFPTNLKRKFGVRCVYSTEHLKYPKNDGSVCVEKPGKDSDIKLNCNSGFGAATMVTGSFGFFAAAEVINYITRAK